MKKLQKKRKGFTLIELVVVIVIIAILAAVALLSFGNFTKTATDSRIKSEHSQLITAGNMWRAAQPNPALPPSSLSQILKFMDSNKKLAGQEGEGDNITSKYHTLEGGVLTSTFLDEDEVPLKYDFGAVDGDLDVEPHETGQ